MDQKRKPPYQFELSKLTNSSESNILDKTLSEGFKPIEAATEHIDTKEVVPVLKADEWTDKIAKLRALKKFGNKAMSVLPFAGAGYAALQGDPAMAAEELAGDVPVVGQAYEAFKPEAAGQSVEDERMMLAEIQARKNYDQSPAHQARLNALRGFGK